MLHLHVREAVRDHDPIETVRAANAAYLEAYERNAKLMGLLEEVAIVDDSVRALQRKRVAAFGKRNARAIRDLQHQGLADPRLDPEIAAAALSSMVSRMAYAAFVRDEPIERDELVETLTQLWTNALGMTSRVGADAASPARRTPPA
jgi:hypothetical protein